MLLRWRRVASEKGRLRSATVRFVAGDVGDGAPVPAPAAAVAKATPKSPTARRPSTGKASPKAHTGYKSIKAALAAAKLDPSWAAAFDDAAIGVGELQLYASPQELREELERGGTYRVPLAVVSKVLSLVLETNVPSPHAREQALLGVGGGAAPVTTLAAGMACGQAMASAANGEATRRETVRWADIFADEDVMMSARARLAHVRRCTQRSQMPTTTPICRSSSRSRSACPATSALRSSPSAWRWRTSRPSRRSMRRPTPT